MKIITSFLWIVLLCYAFPGVSIAQVTSTDSIYLQRLKDHVYFLASDSLDGRGTGTKGEKIAAQYIAEQFKRVGLKPAIDDSFFQFFEFRKGRKVNLNDTYLKINRFTFTQGKDFIVLPQSSEGDIQAEVIKVGYGIVAPEQQYDDYLDKDSATLKGKIFLIESGAPDNNPHAEIAPFATQKAKIEAAVSRGASAVIFYSTNSETEIKDAPINRQPGYNIPIIFLKEQAFNLLSGQYQLKSILKLDIETTSGDAANVVGFFDNNAVNSVFIGAHYDHLGFGEFGGALSTQRDKPFVGADDNASGIALIIELADRIKKNNLKNFNYYFIAFSGEELGLLGSSYFTNNPPITLENSHYMLNFDMVGRLDTAAGLHINGIGTSPIWQQLIDSVTPNKIKLRKGDSGVGPSDHTSFYIKDIPVLHFFTGSHSDYHKPSDLPELVNYNGLFKILNYTTYLTDTLDKLNELEFTRTKETENKAVPRFTVSLGIIPDYGFDGAGVRVSGVSEGKTAEKAGIKSGDVITAMNDFVIKDMMSYMTALSKYKRGDKTIVTFRRGETIITKEIVFE